MNRTIIISWVLLVAALAAAGGVVYAGIYIKNAAIARAAEASTSEQQSDRVVFSQHLRSLAAETQADREKLDALVHNDIVNVVDMLERTAQAANVKATVSGALPSGAAVQLPGGVSLQSIIFVVQAEGTFAALMHAAELYEHLPLPSSVEQIDLERDRSAGAKGLWRIKMDIRLLTTSDVSS